MKLSAPKIITWVIALIIAIVGLFVYIVFVPGISIYAFWLMVVAVAILLIGTVFKGI
jgi:hypothetical protein